MPQSYDKVVLHTIFGTKYRQPLITPEVEPVILEELVKNLAKHGSITIRINATENHVHIIHTLPRTISIADLLEDIKKFSSKDIKKLLPNCRNFYWQDGYFVVSVDPRPHKMTELIEYVDRQKEHHDSGNPDISFQVEILKILQSFGIHFEQRYLFPLPPKKSSRKRA